MLAFLTGVASMALEHVVGTSWGVELFESLDLRRHFSAVLGGVLRSYLDKSFEGPSVLGRIGSVSISLRFSSLLLFSFWVCFR